MQHVIHEFSTISYLILKCVLWENSYQQPLAWETMMQKETPIAKDLFFVYLALKLINYFVSVSV